MTKTIFLLTCILAFALPTDAQHRKKLFEWHVPVYEGITVGKSTRAELFRRFGKPKRVFNPEDEYDSPVMSLISYDYNNLAGFQGRTIFTVKKRNNVINEIMLVPSGENTLDHAWMLSRFGKGYLKFTENPCFANARLDIEPDRSESVGGQFFLYPSKGVFIIYDPEEHIQEIVFARKCP